MIQNFFGIVLFVQAAAPILAQDTPPARPNIVWLTTEDNGANWYRLYHPQGAPMPTVERLAKEGLVFNHAYSCGPVCSTARSTLISGCYAPRLGAQYHRQQRPVAMPNGLHLFPWYLREAGYHTSNQAKTDYNFRQEEVEGVWDASSGQATYRQRRAGQPFFHVRNFGQTHESQLFPKLPPGVDPIVEPAAVQLFPYHPDTPLFREKYAQYLTLQTIADAAMGEVVDQLQADGLLDDTFIFHFGDHGGVLPGSKGYARNDGLQVPMVVYVPKNWQHLAPAPRGTRVDGIVEFVDLSATVLNLAGVAIPPGLDGRPFLGKSVSREELQRRDTALGYAERFDEKYDMVRFLRHGQYTYWRSYQPFNFDGLYNEYRYKQPAYREWRKLAESGRLNPAQQAFFEPRPAEMLFDLEQDPHEVNNLAGDPQYHTVLASLRQRLQRRLKEMPDLGFIPEPIFLEESGSRGAEYGKQHQARIAKLIDIADLQFRPLSEVAEELTAALQSDDPLERYWGLITCSAFGQEADRFVERARDLAATDPHLLVRVRAAEFLGLVGAADPQPTLIAALQETSDPIAANLILNTAVLLRDGEPGWPFEVAPLAQAKWADSKEVVQRRLEYLRSAPDNAARDAAPKPAR